MNPSHASARKVEIFPPLSAAVVVLQDELRALEIELHGGCSRVCGGGDCCRHNLARKSSRLIGADGEGESIVG